MDEERRGLWFVVVVVADTLSLFDLNLKRTPFQGSAYDLRLFLLLVCFFSFFELLSPITLVQFSRYFLVFMF